MRIGPLCHVGWQKCNFLFRKLGRRKRATNEKDLRPIHKTALPIDIGGTTTSTLRRPTQSRRFLATAWSACHEASPKACVKQQDLPFLQQAANKSGFEVFQIIKKNRKSPLQRWNNRYCWQENNEKCEIEIKTPTHRNLNNLNKSENKKTKKNCVLKTNLL